MKTYVYLWNSDKIGKPYGIVNCYGDDENGYVCVDEYGDFSKELGIDKIEVIGYFESMKKAEEYMSKFVK